MTSPDSNMLAPPIIPRLFGLAPGGGDGDIPRVPAGLWDPEADDSGGDGMPSPLLAVAPTTSSRFTAGLPSQRSTGRSAFPSSSTAADRSAPASKRIRTMEIWEMIQLSHHQISIQLFTRTGRYLGRSFVNNFLRVALSCLGSMKATK